TADRVAIQAEPTVSPGGIATYTFRVKAPMAAGIYPLRLRLVADGVTWLDDEDVVSLVTVGATAGASTDKALLTSPATFTFVAGADPLTTAANQSVKVTTTVTSLIASTAVIGIDVYAPGGSTVAFEKWFPNESFGAGEQRPYTATWTRPAAAPHRPSAVNRAAPDRGRRARRGRSSRAPPRAARSWTWRYRRRARSRRRIRCGLTTRASRPASSARSPRRGRFRSPPGWAPTR